MTAALDAPPDTPPDAAPAAAAPDRTPRLRRALDLLLLGGALPFVLVGLARSTAFAEGDTYWQVVAGAEILQRRTTALVEHASWTAAGTPWHPNSWLYDVLVERAWAAAGWVGLGLFTVLTVSGVGAAVALVGRRLGAGAPAIAWVSAMAAVPVVSWLSARPQTVSYALLVLLVGLAARVATGSGVRSWLVGAAALGALTAVWVNLHLAALVGAAAVGGGLAVAAAGPLVALARRRCGPAATAAQLARPAVVVLAVVLGCLCSPLGTDVLSSAGHTAGASTGLIEEWAPLGRARAVSVATWVAAAVCLVVLAAAWWRSATAHRTPTWLPFWTGAVATLLLAGIGAVRFAPMALVVALPAVAAVLPLVRPARAPWLVRRLALGLPVAVAVGVAVVAVTGVDTFGRPGPHFPTAATVAAVPDGCRVLNEYDEGGLITLLRGADGVRVAVDGRNDVYGRDTVERVDALADGSDGALADLAAADVRCLLLRPDRPLVARAEAAGWRVAARDDARVLLVAP